MSVSAKDLLAKQTEKLGAHRSPVPAISVPVPTVETPKPTEETPKATQSADVQLPQKTVTFPKPKRQVISSNEDTAEKAGPTQKKGITLRQSNLDKLDDLELSLRKRGIKANHSGLIQIAIEKLIDTPELVEDYKKLQKLDLRLK